MEARWFLIWISAALQFPGCTTDTLVDTVSYLSVVGGVGLGVRLRVRVGVKVRVSKGLLFSLEKKTWAGWWGDD